MAPIERYTVYTHIQPLDTLYTVYDIIRSNPNIDSIEFEKGATIGYIQCNVSGEGIRGYEKAYSLLKEFKMYCRRPTSDTRFSFTWREPNIRPVLGGNTS